ncbi:MAG: MAPEG family protein [Gammaproteobacteria bacterium]
MSPEMTVLALVTLFYLFAWVPPLIAKSRVYGTRWLFGEHSVLSRGPLPEAVERMVLAHDNFRESYPPFAVAVLLLAFSGGFTRLTAFAAWVYLVARLVHMPAASFGLPLLRGLVWLLGLAATLYLLAMALVALV